MCVMFYIIYMAVCVCIYINVIDVYVYIIKS